MSLLNHSAEFNKIIDKWANKNLFYSYGDGVELEIYTCNVCDSDYAVQIEIKRDFESMELCI